MGSLHSIVMNTGQRKTEKSERDLSDLIRQLFGRGHSRFVMDRILSGATVAQSLLFGPALSWRSFRQ